MKLMNLDGIIANEIKYMIEKNKMKCDDKLPSERELSEKFDVQRITLRSALRILEEQGVIYSKPRSGYYVSKPKIWKRANRIVSTTDKMKELYDDAKLKVLKFTEMEANKYLSFNADVPIGTRLYEVKRLRMIGDEPISVEYSFIPKKIANGLEKYDLSSRSMYHVFTEEFHLKLYHSNQRIIVDQVEEQHSKLLNIAMGEKIVIQMGTLYDENENLIEYYESYMKPNRFVYVSEDNDYGL